MLHTFKKKLTEASPKTPVQSLHVPEVLYQGVDRPICLIIALLVINIFLFKPKRIRRCSMRTFLLLPVMRWQAANHPEHTSHKYTQQEKYSQSV